MRDPKDIEIRALLLQKSKLERKVSFYKNIFHSRNQLTKQHDKIVHFFDKINDKLAEFISFYEEMMQQMNELMKGK